jgi:lipopolysaccharide export LptBFGC system permease protein LptF
MSAWPLFSMRFDRSYPTIVRPVAAITATLIFTVGSFAFLAVWTNPDQPMVGLWERVIAVAQVLYLSLVIVVAWLHQQGAARALRETTGT